MDKGGLAQLIFFWVVLLGLFYFLLIRPQQVREKKHKELIASLKKGDRVVTAGGIHGTVVGLKEETVMLQVSQGAVIEVDKKAISRRLPKPRRGKEKGGR